MRRSAASTFLSIAIMLLPLNLYAQTLTADEVVEKYTNAIGGQSALDGIRSMRYERHLHHLDENRVIKQICYQMRDNYVRYENAERGSIFIANNGKRFTGRYNESSNSWVWDEGEYASKETYILNRLGAVLDYKKRGITLEYGGVRTINEAKTHHIKMHLSETTIWDLYFDDETHLLVLVKPTESVEIAVFNYTRVEDVLIPFRTEGRGSFPDGRKWHHINKIISVDLNVSLDESHFRFSQDGLLSLVK